MEIGERIDVLYALRAERLALQRQVDDLKAKEVAEKESIRLALDGVGLARASGRLATAGITVKEVPVPSDWEKIHEYIRTTGEFDLIQRRLSVEAWKARKDSGILVPGTETSEVWDLSLTKASRS